MQQLNDQSKKTEQNTVNGQPKKTEQNTVNRDKSSTSAHMSSQQQQNQNSTIQNNQFINGLGNSQRFNTINQGGSKIDLAQQQQQFMQQQFFKQNSAIPNSQQSENQKQTQTKMSQISIQNSNSNTRSSDVNEKQNQRYQQTGEQGVKTSALYQTNSQINNAMEIEQKINPQQMSLQKKEQFNQPTNTQEGYIEPRDNSIYKKNQFEQQRVLPSAGDRQEVQQQIQIKKPTKVHLSQYEMIEKLLQICKENKLQNEELETIQQDFALQFCCCESKEEKILKCSSQKCNLHLNCFRNHYDNFDYLKQFKCACGLELPIRVLQQIDTIGARCCLEYRLQQESKKLQSQFNGQVWKCPTPYCSFWCIGQNTQGQSYCINCQVHVQLEKQHMKIVMTQKYE